VAKGGVHNGSLQARQSRVTSTWVFTSSVLGLV